MKISKATKYGGTIILPLTGFIDLDKEYLIRKEDKKVIIEPVEDVIKN